jgi:hypothetical protein
LEYIKQHQDDLQSPEYKVAIAKRVNALRKEERERLANTAAKDDRGILARIRKKLFGE